MKELHKLNYEDIQTLTYIVTEILKCKSLDKTEKDKQQNISSSQSDESCLQMNSETVNTRDITLNNNRSEHTGAIFNEGKFETNNYYFITGDNYNVKSSLSSSSIKTQCDNSTVNIHSRGSNEITDKYIAKLESSLSDKDHIIDSLKEKIARLESQLCP